MPDVVLDLRYGTVGPEQHATAGQLAKDAGATDCRAWIMNPLSQGGAGYVVHLRVPADQQGAAIASLLRQNVNVQVRPLAELSAAPPPYRVDAQSSGAGTVVTPAALGCG